MKIDFNKFNNIELSIYPFPHFVIKDLFNQRDMDKLTFNFPKDLIRKDGQSSKNRYTLIHNSDNFKSLVSTSKPWSTFYKIMNSNVFQEKIKDLYKKTNDFANLGDVDNIDLSFQMDVTFAKQGYQRSIHLDRNHHFFNSFIYLNGHDEFGGTGGELELHEVKPKNGLYDKFPSEKDILYTKTIKIEKNSLVGFFCCPYSYHSVVPMKNNTGTRNFIYCALNEAAGSDLWPKAQVVCEKRRERFLNQ